LEVIKEVAMPVPKTWREIERKPGFENLSGDQVKQLKMDWIKDKAALTDNPGDPKIIATFAQQAGLQSDGEEQSWWQKVPISGGKHFWPKSGEEFTQRLWQGAQRAGNVFSAAQQLIPDVAKRAKETREKEGFRWWDPSGEVRSIGPALEKTLSNLYEDVVTSGDVGRQPRELEYPYHWYTDPAVLYEAPKIALRAGTWGLKKAGKYGEKFARGAEKIGELARGVEQAPQATRQTVTEVGGGGRVAREVSARRPTSSLPEGREVPGGVGGTPGGAPPRVRRWPETVRPQEPLFPPTGSKPAADIIKRVQGSGYSSEEAMAIQKWALENPASTYSEYITKGIGKLPNAVKDFIDSHILKGVSLKSAPKVRPKDPFIVSPKIEPAASVSLPEAINSAPVGSLGEFAELLKP
jgi:hypothetical protein